MLIDLSNINDAFLADNLAKNSMSQDIFKRLSCGHQFIKDVSLSGKWTNKKESLIQLLEKRNFIKRYETNGFVYSGGAELPKTFLYEKEKILVNLSVSKKEDCNLHVFGFLCEGLKEELAAFELFCHEISEQLKNEKKETKDKIYMFCESRSGVYISEIGKDYYPIVRGNYSNVVIAQYDRIVAEFSKKDSTAGNIVIFRGEPGCGKTYLIRSLVGDLKDCVCLYLAPGMLSSLAAPTLLTKLLEFSEEHEGKKIVVLLEDADQVLAPRMNDNVADIATLLNLADGILGKILNIKIIATTNQEAQKFDKAILRPGRLLSNCEVGKLSVDQAISIFNRETKQGVLSLTENFPKYMTLAEVYETIQIGRFYKEEAYDRHPSFYKKVGF